MKQIYTELQKLNVKEPKSSNRVQENLFLIIKRKYYKNHTTWTKTARIRSLCVKFYETKYTSRQAMNA